MTQTPAQKASQKRYRARYREKVSLRHLRWRLSRTYGLSLEDHAAILVEQRGCCAICKASLDGRLYIDHDHTTGKIRGFLCNLCNVAIGYLRDDPAIATSAALYLGAGGIRFSIGERRVPDLEWTAKRAKHRGRRPYDR